MSQDVPDCLADYDIEEKNMPDEWPRIYLFGDSLTERAFSERTEGFGVALRKYYEGRGVGVVNRGVSGFTSRWLRSFFDTRIIQEASTSTTPPLLITIFLGANDACLPPTSAHVPLPEFEGHIRNYVDSILSNPATVGTRVLLITPPPVNVLAPHEETWESDIPAVREALMRDVEAEVEDGRGYKTWLSKRDYAKRIAELGKEYSAKTHLVNVLYCWTRITEFGRATAEERGWTRPDTDLEERIEIGCGLPGAPEFDEDIFVDGLHFGDKGYRVLSRALIDFLTETWPELKKDLFSPVEE